MEFIASKYYQHLDRFSNIYYTIIFYLETIFGREIFKEQANRIIYASNEFAFRRRLQILDEQSYGGVESLQFPFANYWRSGPIVADDRPALINAGAALNGVVETSINGEELPYKVRYLNTKFPLTYTFYFDRDDDAQLAYEYLLWFKNPSLKVFETSIYFRGFEVGIPILLTLDEVLFNPENYNEKTWLEKNRVFPIEANFTVRSVSIKPYAQTSNSKMFPQAVDNEFALTEKVVLDFLSYHGVLTQELIDMVHIELEITAAIDPAYGVTITLTNETSGETSVKLNWTITITGEPVTIDRLYLIKEGFDTPIELDKTAVTYTFTDLSPDSTYKFYLFAVTSTGAVKKKDIIVTTAHSTSEPDIKGMKGIIGLTF